jgi:hypothetical protein
MIVYPISRCHLSIRELAGLHLSHNDCASIY